MRCRRSAGAVAIAIALSLAGSACGGSDAADGTTTTVADGVATQESTTTAAQVLTILVSNDDGYAAPGIDAVVRALSALPDTEVVVAAPKENQSGSGSTTTEGQLEVTEVQTASGHPATAVAGFPADSVNWALDGGIDVTPDLVVTGVNSGQNLGKVGDELSGTVGAARAAAARGIPALATSVALDDAADYDAAAVYVTDWVQEHRDAILAGELDGDDVIIENLNVPVCATGEVRGVVEVPMSTSSDGAIAVQDCESELEDPTDDIVAFNNGFVTLSVLSLEPAS